MLEINRGIALLGPKTQECNTHDKQHSAAAPALDQTTGLLHGQTRWNVAGRVALAAGDRQQSEWAKRAGLRAADFWYISQESFVQTSSPVLHCCHHAGRWSRCRSQAKAEILALRWFAGDDHAGVWGVQPQSRTGPPCPAVRGKTRADPKAGASNQVAATSNLSGAQGFWTLPGRDWHGISGIPGVPRTSDNLLTAAVERPNRRCPRNAVNRGSAPRSCPRCRRPVPVCGR
jgi:hypothetical protein